MDGVKKILVVDDEADICNILKFNLDKAGYETATALSAEDALMRGIIGYDLVLLDVMMEGISGFQMAQMMKKNPESAKIPIIFITAKDTEEDTLKGFDLGADDYIAKPFSVREVVSRVNAVLRRVGSASSDPARLSYKTLTLDMNGKNLWTEMTPSLPRRSLKYSGFSFPTSGTFSQEMRFSAKSGLTTW